jgi:imidazolonepropionase
MGISDITGSISIGKLANLIITNDISTYQFLPYAYGSDLINTVILKGEVL